MRGLDAKQNKRFCHVYSPPMMNNSYQLLLETIDTVNVHILYDSVVFFVSFHKSMNERVVFA